MHVMVVTQQDEIKQLVGDVLAGSGDEMLLATDLATGLALAVEHAPALAIIDIALAGGAALAMVHHIAASSPQTAIHVLALPAAFEAAAEALSLGAAGLLVAPPTGDAILRAVADIHARTATEDRVVKLTTEARDASELVDAMTQALLVAKAGDLRALAETLLTLFLIASGARGVAIYGEEGEDGLRRRISGYGTALELLDRYNDLELAQLASARQAEIVGLAASAQMFGCVLLERADPMRTGRVHRVIEFATALMPLCAMARAAIAEDSTAPRSRALPAHVFVRLVQRDVDGARDGRDVVLLCAVARKGEIDTGPLGPAVGLAGAAIGQGDAGELYVLLPKTPFAAARSLLLDVPLAVGLACAAHDGKRAEALMQIARARAMRALTGYPDARALRDRSLAEVVSTLSSAQHETFKTLDVGHEALDSMVLHACRHARAISPVEVFVAHGDDAPAILGTVRAAIGSRATVRDLRLADAALRGALLVVVVTPRAGWALLARTRDGQTRTVHTSDASVIELLRGRLAEVA